jgi:putative DNA primase/helicase
VIWTDGHGQDWPEAKVREVYPDQGFLLVEESTTGFPIHQVRFANVGAHLNTALSWLRAGFSPLPPREDTTKAPTADVQVNGEWTWTPYQTTPATEAHVRGWYRRNRSGCGVCGGPGGLEPFEFDDRGTYEAFKTAAVAFGLEDLIRRIEAGYLEDTPGGGVHWFYVCDDVRPPAKLAERPDLDDPKNRRKTLIETKGQGGFIIVAPSNGKVHQSGGAYRLLQGSPETIARISADEREALWQLARTFDEMPREESVPDFKIAATSSPDRDDVVVRAGDDFNAKAKWADILEPAGWKAVHTSGPVTYWRRPGKDSGWSATTGKTKGFRVFTSSTSLQAGESYSPFGLYCHLRHQGDWTACVKDLAEQGYGSWIDEDGREHQNPRPKGSKVQESSSRSAIEVNEAPDDPHRLARLYADRAKHTRFYRGEWLQHDGSAYRPVKESELHSGLACTIKAEFNRLNRIAVEFWTKEGSQGPKPESRKVTRTLVSNTTLALQSITRLSGKVEAPSWLESPATFPPAEIVPTRTALVHLPSIADPARATTPATPRFFCSYALDFGFDPAAARPIEWLKFLDSLWDDDRQSIDTLQEWFGYCLTPDTRQQKILSLIGPRRAGKDTIARVLTYLVGAENTAGPTLSGLAGPFGLAPLIGKPLAIVSDARISGRTDAGVIVERLLTISGEGRVDVDRKYQETWTGKLPTRFVLISNELPRLTDSSGALAGRMILLRLTRSFYGHEDLGLFDRLVPELPGIFLWACEGWRRLRERGYLAQPQTGLELIEHLEELSSPVTAFVRERCEVGPGKEVETQALWEAWCDWCKSVGRKEPGTAHSFARDLRAACPFVSTRQTRVGNKPTRFYTGLDLRIIF